MPLFKDRVPATFAKPSGPVMAAGQRAPCGLLCTLQYHLRSKRKRCKSICLDFLANTVCNVLCGVPASFISVCFFLFCLESSGLEHSGSNDHGITKVAARYTVSRRNVPCPSECRTQKMRADNSRCVKLGMCTDEQRPEMSCNGHLK